MNIEVTVRGLNEAQVVQFTKSLGVPDTQIKSSMNGTVMMRWSVEAGDGEEQSLVKRQQFQERLVTLGQTLVQW